MNRRRTHLFQILPVMLAVFAACSKNPHNFVLNGTVDGSGEDTILVTGLDIRYDHLDTIFVHNGKFTYKCYIDTVTPLILLYKDGRDDVVFAEKGLKTEFHTDSIGSQTYVDGGICDRQYREMLPILANDTTTSMIINHIDSFIQTNPLSEVAPYLIYKYCVQEEQASKEQILRLTKLMSGQMSENPFITAVTDVVDKHESNILTLEKYSVADTTLAKKTFKDIAEDEYILFYFWASWDKSRQDTKASLQAIEQEYNDRMYSIVGISLDTEQGRWKNAILEDSLQWAQYSDLKGWNSRLVQELGIERLPYYVLVRPGRAFIAARGKSVNNIVEQLKVLPVRKKKKK